MRIFVVYISRYYNTLLSGVRKSGISETVIIVTRGFSLYAVTSCLLRGEEDGRLNGPTDHL